MRTSRNAIIALMLCVASIGYGAANDIRVQQQTSAGSFPDRIFPGQSAISSTLASYLSAIGVGAEDSPTFAGIAMGATTPGLIGGTSGAITFTAAGTNQSLTFVPSGTGQIRMSGNVLLGGLAVNGTGLVQFPAAVNSAGGFFFGTDTALHRFTPGGMKLDAPAGGAACYFDLSENGTSKARLQTASGVVSLTSLSSATVSLAVNDVAQLTVASGKATTIGIHHSTGGFKRVTSQFDATSSTALANVTGLSVSVQASTSYRFRAVLFTTSNVAGGVKFAVAGTATATNVIYEAIVHNAAAVSAQTRAAALATEVGGVTAVTVANCVIEGSIAVNAAGTLTVQFAQNASNGTASSVLVGSYMEVFGF